MVPAGEKSTYDQASEATMATMSVLFGLGMAAWRFNLYLRRRRHDRRWLANLDAAVSAGGTIFETH